MAQPQNGENAKWRKRKMAKTQNGENAKMAKIRKVDVYKEWNTTSENIRAEE
jgi:hypothetical protein